jgi:DNA-binding LytR/AlgR family response regulator
LLKPIRRNDLAESIQKYRSLKSALSIDFDMLLANIQGKEPDHKKRFLIQIGEKIRKVEVSEIAYFYVLEKGVYLRTFQGNNYPVEFTLDKLETILNPQTFFRINRKYMVNMESIANMVAYSRARIKLELKPKADDADDTIVSIDRSAEFKKWLNT